MEKVDLFGGGDAGEVSVRRFTPVDTEPDVVEVVDVPRVVDAVDARVAATSERSRGSFRKWGFVAAGGVSVVGVLLVGFLVMSPSSDGSAGSGSVSASGTEVAAPPVDVPVVDAGSESPGALDGVGVDGPAGTNAGVDGSLDAPMPVVENVRSTVIIQFAPQSAELSAEGVAALGVLAEGLAVGESVTVSSYAGFTAGDAWADEISRARGAAIREALAGFGVGDRVVVIPSGKQPAALDGAASDAIGDLGVVHNRVAVVTAATVR
jgi:outer membrane protein OmpA-like peptidoglycan-associated protein